MLWLFGKDSILQGAPKKCCYLMKHNIQNKRQIFDTYIYFDLKRTNLDFGMSLDDFGCNLFEIQVFKAKKRFKDSRKLAKNGLSY